MELLVELWPTLDHARFLADATPLDFDPDSRVTCCRNRLYYIQLSDVHNEISHVGFQALNASLLLELGHAGQADKPLDRSTLEQLLSVQLVSVDLHLNFKLAVQHTLQADTAWYCKLFRGHAFVQQPDVKELFSKLRLRATVDDTLAYLLPVR